MSEAEIRNLLANGELSEALSRLVQLASQRDQRLHDDVTVLLSRLRALEREADLGLVGAEPAAVQRAKITQSALRLSRRLDAEAWPAAADPAVRTVTATLPTKGETNSAGVALHSPETAVRTPSAAPFAPLRVFVSYAHEQALSSGSRSLWLDELLVQLRPLEREKLVTVWSDRRIADGTRFDDVIRVELERADVAILLVNARFLASDYIYNYELPLLLERWQQGSLCAYVLVLEPADLVGTRFKYPDPDTGPHVLSLGELQAAHPPERPLAALSLTDAQAILATLATKLRSLSVARSRP
jgi:hypothetical protein